VFAASFLPFLGAKPARPSKLTAFYSPIATVRGPPRSCTDKCGRVRVHARERNPYLVPACHNQYQLGILDFVIAAEPSRQENPFKMRACLPIARPASIPFANQPPVGANTIS